MSTRIKDNDPFLERAWSVADALQAARQPAHQGMRLGEMIDALAVCDPKHRVEFDFGGFEPSGIDSYRGYYSDLALSFSENGLDVAGLLAELRDADGGVFEGYKGGEYRMDRSTPVWVANPGRSHGVAVVGVDAHSWRVVIRTALID
jgi:hypothetical protein